MDIGTRDKINNCNDPDELIQMMNGLKAGSNTHEACKVRLDAIRHKEIFKEQKTTRKLTVYILVLTLILLVMTAYQIFRRT